MAVSRTLKAGKDFRNEMIDYIRQHFTDLLGPHVELLDEEGGLDQLADMVRRGKISA